MKKKHIIKLNDEQRRILQEILKKGKVSAQARNRAQIFLLSDKGKKDKEIANTVFMTERAIAEIRRKYCER